LKAESICNFTNPEAVGRVDRPSIAC